MRTANVLLSEPIEIGARSWVLWDWVARMAAIAPRYGWDIVQTAGPVDADVHHVFCEAHVSRYPGLLKRAILTVHSLTNLVPERSLKTIAPAVKAARAVTAVCGQYAVELGTLRNDVEVTPAGVDLAVFQPGADGPRSLPFRIGIGGRHYAEGFKGDELRHATALRLKDAGVPVVFVFIGQRWQPIVHSLMSDGVACEMHERGKSYAHPDDEGPLYADLDAFLVTSRVDGGPVTALQALACGVPVVTTPVGHASERVDAWPGTGRVVDGLHDEKHADDMADALREVLRGGRASRYEIAATTGDLSWTDCTERFVHLYERLSAAGKAA